MTLWWRWMERIRRSGEGLAVRLWVGRPGLGLEVEWLWWLGAVRLAGGGGRGVGLRMPRMRIGEMARAGWRGGFVHRRVRCRVGEGPLQAARHAWSGLAPALQVRLDCQASLPFTVAQRGRQCQMGMKVLGVRKLRIYGGRAWRFTEFSGVGLGARKESLPIGR